MKGSPKYLARNLMKALSPTWRGPKDVASGPESRSRHGRKKEVRAAAKKSGQNLTQHQLAKHMGVYSVATKVRYRHAFTQFFEYIRETYNIRSTKTITPAHVQEYLELKIAQGARRQTLYTYASAMEKLEVALNRRTNAGYNWKDAIAESRKHARDVLDNDVKSRSYKRPEALINKVENATYQIAAKLQLEGGARISEISELTERNISTDEKSFILTNTKGGRQRPMVVSKELTETVTEIIRETGQFMFNRADYARELRIAAGRSGQGWNGSHGLRWNYAQRTFVELQKSGTSYDDALLHVARCLGHSRPGITLRYLQ